MSLYEAQAMLAAEKNADAYTLFNREYANGNRDVHVRLGIIASLMKLGKFAEAADFAETSNSVEVECRLNQVQCYERCGKKEEAYKMLVQLLDTRQSRLPDLYRKLVVMAQDKQDWPVVIRSINQLFELGSTEDVSLLNAIANAYLKTNQHTLAIAYFLAILDKATTEQERLFAHSSLAGVYKDTGRQAKAMEHFHETARLSATPEIMSNHLMMLQYAEGYTLNEFYQKGAEYSLKFLKHLPKYDIPAERFDSGKSKTGLKIAFIGGDFCMHSLGNLLLQPFLHFKRVSSNHTFTVYMRRKNEDASSEKYRSAVHNWRNVADLSNADIAKQLFDDQIDILVDTSGHTALNNIPVFGYCAVPVQAGWISGMMTPPGIPEVGYFLTDPYMRPKEASLYCHEELYELPSAFTYFPLAQAVPDVNPIIPYDRTGLINFGSFNNPCKIGISVMTAWARAMQIVPNSVLHVKLYSLAQAHELQRLFAGFGIQSGRIKVVYNLPRTEDAMSYYTDNIDIVLDTWPCAGMLTSAEAMWMGCPVATVRGNTFLHNQSWSCLKQVGLDAWGTESKDDFPMMVHRLCSDLDKLRDIRKNLRTMMSQAPMRNPEKVATAAVEAFERMWIDRCQRRAALCHLLRPTDTP
jgi:predicted O-linked N-acetylglucosamine transferase (SPINDLY family)